MSLSSRLVLSIVIITLINGASAIDVCFSASDGGESVSIWNYYMVDDKISINDDAKASFTSVGIKGSGSVSGSGDVHVTRSYEGSGGVSGGNDVDAEDATGISLISTVNLLPGTLDATQTGSITDGNQIKLTSYAIDDGAKSQIVTDIPQGSFSGGSSISAGHSTSSNQVYTISGNTFTSTASATGTDPRTRIPGYGTLWDLIMGASPGGGGSTTEGTLGYHIDNHQSIQSAVDASEDGDFIILLPKTYYENVWIWKSLTLIGAGADQTTIIGDGINPVIKIASKFGPQAPADTSSPSVPMVQKIYLPIILKGASFTSRGGGAGSVSSSYAEGSFGDKFNMGGGIDSYAAGDSLTLIGCKIYGNTAVYGGGIYNHEGCNAKIYDTQIYNNFAIMDGAGIYNENNALVTLTDSEVFGNIAGNKGGGVYNLGTVQGDQSQVHDNAALTGANIHNEPPGVWV